MTMPSTSPMAQPVRQCSVAVMAVRVSPGMSCAVMVVPFRVLERNTLGGYFAHLVE